MIDYLIYATPRSGSAWLSNFLTYGDSFCYHEPLRFGRALDTFAKPAPLTGAADTGAYLFDVRAARKFALVRDPGEVMASLRRLGLPQVQDWRAFEDVAQGLTIWRYEQMFDVGYLREIWAEVVGHGFCEPRAAQLIDQTVEWRI